MNPLLYTIPLLAAAYLAASDAAEVVKATEDVAKQIDQAQTDPISRKVWDAKAAEWVSLNEFLRRLRSGETYRRVEQVPFSEPVIRNGLQVLIDRQEAVRRHWEHVLYLERQLCKGFICPN